jgi:hypothetical protein
MSSSKITRSMLATASAALLMSSPFAASAGEQQKSHGKTNINLAVAWNFYGVPTIQQHDNGSDKLIRG